MAGSTRSLAARKRIVTMVYALWFLLSIAPCIIMFPVWFVKPYVLYVFVLLDCTGAGMVKCEIDQISVMFLTDRMTLRQFLARSLSIPCFILAAITLAVLLKITYPKEYNAVFDQIYNTLWQMTPDIKLDWGSVQNPFVAAVCVGAVAVWAVVGG